MTARVLVTGFPRSGLGLVAGHLAAGSAPALDTPGLEHPPSGRVAAQVLARLGARWDRGVAPPVEEQRRAELVALVRGALEGAPDLVVDPEAALLLPLWRQADPGLRVVLCVRHPMEAVQSAAAATGADPAALIEAWPRYYAEPTAARVVVTCFEAWFHDAAAEAARVAAALGRSAVPLVPLVPLDPTRRHHVAPDEPVPETVRLTWEAVLAAAPVRVGTSRADVAALTAARAEARELRRRVIELETLALRSREAADRAEAEQREFASPMLRRGLRAGLVWRERLLPLHSRRRVWAARLWSRFTEPRGDPEEQRSLPAVTFVARSTPRVVVLTPVVAPADVALSATWESLRAQRGADWVWRIVTTAPPGALSSPGVEWVHPDRLALSEAETVVVADAGSRLSPEALRLLAGVLDASPAASLAYGDVDAWDADEHRRSPWFKPAWSPDLLLSADLLSGALAVRADVLQRVGGLGDGGAIGRHDLSLRLAEVTRDARRVAEVLTHAAEDPLRRAAPGAERRALRDALVGHLARQGRTAPDVTWTAAGWPLASWRSASEPRVSIVIPSRDRADLLGRCLAGLYDGTTYRRFEVVVVDNGSREAATRALYEEYARRGSFRVVPYNEPFNFSTACNRGARAARGDALLFLNNDTEVLEAGWLDRMVRWLDVPAVGAVGARLLFPDGTLQHAGVIVGMAGLASHLMHGTSEGSQSCFGSDDWVRDLSAVTAACLLMSRELFDGLGGFDESYRLAYSDVELCLRVRAAGRRVVYAPDVRLLHHESQTHQRHVYRSDYERLSQHLEQYGLLRDPDPLFNPNLSWMSPWPVRSLGPGDHPAAINRRLMRRLPRRERLQMPADLL